MVANKKIETGMLVVPQGGGIPMRVRAISGDHAYCEWFVGRERQQGTFALSTLEVYEPDQPGRDGDR